jgi:aminoglycoside phosphotransferase (APT) family kinase protein
MQSTSKTALSAATLQTIVTHHFGGAAQLRAAEELKDGYFNAAYRLDLADGFRCVLKVAPPANVRVLRYEADIMTAEVEAMRLVKARTRMPVPEIYAHDRARAVIDNEYYLMAFLAGGPFNKLKKTLAVEDRQRIEREIGAHLAEMNAITGPAFGYFPPSSPRFAAWRAAFDFMLDGVLADGQDMAVALPRPDDELRELLRASYPALDEITTPQLVHWDLWDGNVFVDPATAQITGVFDFERALWGDPLMEMNFSPLARDTVFAEGYGRDMLATPQQRIRRTLYNIYVYLIMVIECYYRLYPTRDQENWIRPWLAAELTELETLQRLA